MTQEALARKLRVLRAERGITLDEAEKLTGVTRETLGALEHGQRGAYTSTLEKVAAGYGTTVSALLEEEPGSLAGASSGRPLPTETTGAGHIEVLPPAASVNEALQRLVAHVSLLELRLILQETAEERLHGFIEDIEAREEDAARQVAILLHRLGITREQAREAAPEAARLSSETLAKDFEIFKEANRRALEKLNERRQARAADETA
jgi:transcriptional regulator with XRE-family HTH domain